MAELDLEAQEAQIRSDLVAVQTAIRGLAARLTDLTQTADIDSTSQVSGFKGSQRMAQLMEREKALMEQLDAIPYCQPVPMAMGVDAIGRSLEESIDTSP